MTPTVPSKCECYARMCGLGSRPQMEIVRCAHCLAADELLRDAVTLMDAVDEEWATDWLARATALGLTGEKAARRK